MSLAARVPVRNIPLEARNFLRMNTSGAPFTEILGNRAMQDRVSEQFKLLHCYRKSKIEGRSKDLAEHTGMSALGTFLGLTFSATWIVAENSVGRSGCGRSAKSICDGRIHDRASEDFEILTERRGSE